MDPQTVGPTLKDTTSYPLPEAESELMFKPGQTLNKCGSNGLWVHYSVGPPP